MAGTPGLPGYWRSAGCLLTPTGGRGCQRVFEPWSLTGRKQKRPDFLMTVRCEAHLPLECPADAQWMCCHLITCVRPGGSLHYFPWIVLPQSFPLLPAPQITCRPPSSFRGPGSQRGTLFPNSRSRPASLTRLRRVPRSLAPWPLWNIERVRRPFPPAAHRCFLLPVTLGLSFLPPADRRLSCRGVSYTPHRVIAFPSKTVYRVCIPTKENL